MGDNKEKYYIVHYPSNWGMGSSTDDCLVTGTNLRRLIANELNRKKNGERYDSRFTLPGMKKNIWKVITWMK